MQLNEMLLEELAERGVPVISNPNISISSGVSEAVLGNVPGQEFVMAEFIELMPELAADLKSPDFDGILPTNNPSLVVS